MGLLVIDDPLGLLLCRGRTGRPGRYRVIDRSFSFSQVVLVSTCVLPGFIAQSNSVVCHRRVFSF